MEEDAVLADAAAAVVAAAAAGWRVLCYMPLQWKRHHFGGTQSQQHPDKHCQGTGQVLHKLRLRHHTLMPEATAPSAALAAMLRSVAQHHRSSVSCSAQSRYLQVFAAIDVQRSTESLGHWALAH